MGYLDGKVALVVGGSGGIGAAICHRLASEGASCVVTWHTGKDAAVAVAGDCGNDSTAVKLDCSDVAQCKAVVEAVVEEKTKIDILVLSSGILTGGLDKDEANFDRTIACNVKGHYFTVQAAVPHMPRGGRIIFIGSVFGEGSPCPGIDLYCMTKAAIRGLVACWAQEFAPKGITVNNLSPGPVDTNFNPENGDFAKNVMLPLSSLKRYARAEEVAEAAWYLCGPNSSATTGSTLTVGAGYNGPGLH